VLSRNRRRLHIVRPSHVTISECASTRPYPTRQLGLVQLFTISATTSNNSDANAQDATQQPGNNRTIQRVARPLGGVTIALAVIVLMIGNYFHILQRSSLLSMIRLILSPFVIFKRPGADTTKCDPIAHTGAYRYFRIQKALTVGRFPPARRTMALINGLLIAVVIVVFGVLVAIRQG
jgi:hypothetical protein